MGMADDAYEMGITATHGGYGRYDTYDGYDGYDGYREYREQKASVSKKEIRARYNILKHFKYGDEISFFDKNKFSEFDMSEYFDDHVDCGIVDGVFLSVNKEYMSFEDSYNFIKSIDIENIVNLNDIYFWRCKWWGSRIVDLIKKNDVLKFKNLQEDKIEIIILKDYIPSNDNFFYYELFEHYFEYVYKPVSDFHPAKCKYELISINDINIDIIVEGIFKKFEHFYQWNNKKKCDNVLFYQKNCSNNDEKKSAKILYMHINMWNYGGYAYLGLLNENLDIFDVILIDLSKYSCEFIDNTQISTRKINKLINDSKKKILSNLSRQERKDLLKIGFSYAEYLDYL